MIFRGGWLASPRAGAAKAKSYDAWKIEASGVCQMSRRQLTDLSTGARCMADGYTEVKFECCAVTR